jgi:hypothetical protein
MINTVKQGYAAAPARFVMGVLPLAADGDLIWSGVMGLTPRRTYPATAPAPSTSEPSINARVAEWLFP